MLVSSSFNPLNQVYRLNQLRSSHEIENYASFNPLNQVYRLNQTHNRKIIEADMEIVLIP